MVSSKSWIFRSLLTLEASPYQKCLSLLKSSYLKYNLEQSSLKRVRSLHHQQVKNLFWLPLHLIHTLN